ncbi:Oidioi.mRNA.OKI2018_I69.chr1.g2858.t1.cds [Oikopleura dioica]|uniref:Oidioi.mRNA.OKI2018_I69.chr1.g2858.t1.cds n=1 Tax=Oikopleura dioica TaxID=34765 RepID=A0ABN7T1I6_OIKDI|nr:Oidioi.mRNA.OKI2018_I69.chr1.g2858.t1.cds [Oikopleura dioica]
MGRVATNVKNEFVALTNDYLDKKINKHAKKVASKAYSMANNYQSGKRRRGSPQYYAHRRHSPTGYFYDQQHALFADRASLTPSPERKKQKLAKKCKNAAILFAEKTKDAIREIASAPPKMATAFSFGPYEARFALCPKNTSEADAIPSLREITHAIETQDGDRPMIIQGKGIFFPFHLFTTRKMNMESLLPAIAATEHQAPPPPPPARRSIAYTPVSSSNNNNIIDDDDDELAHEEAVVMETLPLPKISSQDQAILAISSDNDSEIEFNNPLLRRHRRSTAPPARPPPPLSAGETPIQREQRRRSAMKSRSARKNTFSAASKNTFASKNVSTSCITSLQKDHFWSFVIDFALCWHQEKCQEKKTKKKKAKKSAKTAKPATPPPPFESLPEVGIKKKQNRKKKSAKNTLVIPPAIRDLSKPKKKISAARSSPPKLSPMKDPSKEVIELSSETSDAEEENTAAVAAAANQSAFFKRPYDESEGELVIDEEHEEVAQPPKPRKTSKVQRVPNPPKKRKTANAAEKAAKKSTVAKRRTDTPRPRRCKPVPPNCISQMDYNRSRLFQKGDPETPTNDAVGKPTEPRILPVVDKKSTVPRDPMPNLENTVTIEEGEFPLILPSDPKVDEEVGELLRRTDALEITDSEDESTGEIKKRIEAFKKEAPVWPMNRYALRKAFKLAYDSKYGVRPTMADSRIGAWLQRVARKYHHAKRYGQPLNEAEYRIFIENVSKGSSLESFFNEPGLEVGPRVVWDKIGSFFPIFAIDGFVFYYIKDLKIWVHFEKSGWRLVSITDKDLGHPAIVLATLNDMPPMVFPWPFPSAEDPYAKAKSTILLVCGFIPLGAYPEYALEAVDISKKVLQTLCIEEQITQPPSADQMIALNERLENKCYRMVNTAFKMDLLNPEDGLTDEEILEVRYNGLILKMDEMLGSPKPPTKLPLKNRDPFEAIVGALPRVFTENEDVWPQNIFIKTLIYANSCQKFTENPAMMQLFGVGEILPASVVAWQQWLNYPLLDLKMSTAENKRAQVNLENFVTNYKPMPPTTSSKDSTTATNAPDPTKDAQIRKKKARALTLEQMEEAATPYGLHESDDENISSVPRAKMP